MSDLQRTAADAASDLHEALARVATALATTDADAMLEAEMGLGRALTAIGNITKPGDRRTAAADLGRARAGLLRCRRLGASFTSLSRALLRVGDTTPNGYTRAGGYVDRLAGVVSVRVTV